MKRKFFYSNYFLNKMKRKFFYSNYFLNKIYHLENTMEASEIGTPKKIYINYGYLQDVMAELLDYTSKGGVYSLRKFVDYMEDSGVENLECIIRSSCYKVFIRGSIHSEHQLQRQKYLEIEHDSSESTKDFYKALEELLRYVLPIELEHNAKRVISLIKGGRIKVLYLNHVPNWSLSDLYI